MAQDYKLLLQASLDASTIQKQISAIEKNYSFKLAVKLDFGDIDKQIQAFKSQWGQIQKQLAQITNPTGGGAGGVGTGTKQPLSKIIDVDRESRAYEELARRIDKINAEVASKAAKYRITTTINPDDGEKIVRAQISYNDKLGQTVNETMQWVNVEKELNGVKVKDQEWMLVSKQYTDDLDRRNRILQNAIDYAEQFKKKSESLQKTPDVIKGIQAAENLQALAKPGLAGAPVDMKQIEEAKRQLKELDAVVRQNGVSAYSWTKEIGIAIKRTIEWSLSIGLVYGAFNQLREGIQYIVELNKELVNIQVVTNKTNQEMDKMALGFNSLAKELGATTIEVAKGSTEWFRQGKTIEETQELMRSTMMMSKLGALDSAEATQYLTAILNGFKLEAKDAVGVVDKLVAVDNVAATSVGEMATALQRTANMAQESGVSFDALIGYIATVSSTTRKSASTIGESFKTMFARLEAIKLGQLDDLGQSISDVERVLGTMGIKIRDNANTFRNMEDVLDELASKWDSLTDVQRRAAAQAIGGVRQYENLLALMQNYDKAKKLEKVSAESAGLAEQRYGIYLDGVEAAQNRVKASWEKLWMTTLSSDSIKAWYDIAGGILEITDKAGGLIPVLGVVLGLFISFSGQQIIAGIASIGRAFSELIAVLLGVSTAATGAQIALGGIGLAIVAISGAFMLINALTETTAETIDRTNKVIEESSASIKKLGDSKKEIQKLGETFVFLKDKQNKSNAENKMFMDTQNQLKELLPNLSGRFDEYGNFILDASISMDTLNKATEKQIEDQKTLFKEAVIAGTKARTKDYIEQAKELKKLSDRYNFMLKVNAEFNEANSAANMAAGGGYSGEKFDEKQLLLQRIAADKQKVILDQLADKYQEDYDRIDEEGKKYIISELMLAGEEGKILADRLTQTKQFMLDQTKAFSLGEPLGPPIPPYQKYSEFFDKIKGEVNSLSDVLQKAQENKMDLSSYEALLSLGSEYVDLVRIENGEIIVNEDALRRMQIEKLKAIYTSEKFKEATDAEKEALAANIAILEQSTPLSTQYVDTFTQIISGVAQGNEKFLELGQNIAEANRSFETGVYDANQYLEQLQLLTEGVDFKAMFEEDQAGFESFFTGLTYNATQAFSQISSMFDAGKINITDYSEQLANLTDIFGVIGDAFAGYEENLGVAGAAQSEVAGSVDEMNAAADQLRATQEMNIQVANAFVEAQAGALQFGTDAFNETMRTIADAAYASGQAWVDTEGNAFKSADGIYQYLTATDGNFETFANQTASNLGQSIQKVAQAISEILTEIGNSIKNFKGGIKFTPKLSGTGINWGALLKNDLKNVLDFTMDIGIQGTGDFDFSKIGEKITNFAKSLPSKVEAIDFSALVYGKGPAPTKPKTGAGGSGTGGGSAKTAKEEETSVEDLLKIVVAKIKQTKEAEKDALKESLDAYKKNYEEKKKIAKDLYDKEIDRLKTSLENYKDIIETRKELLKSMKEESDYNKEMANKEQALSKTQSEILKLRLDDSEEAKAKLLAMQEQEQKQLEDIKQTQDDKNYQDQINALDNEYNSFEKITNAKMKLEEEAYNQVIDNLDREYEAFKTIIESGIDGIEKYLDKSGQLMVDAMAIVDNKADGLYQDLIDWNNQYGDGVEANVTKAWNDAYKALEKYRNELGQMDSQYVLSVLAKAIIPEYHTGGIVEGKAGQERFAKLMAGEVVVTQSQMERFMKYTLPGVAKTTSAMNNSGNVKFDNLLSLNVQGNMDSSVIPNVEQIVNSAVEKLNKFMLTRGHIRNARQFGN